MRCGRFARPFRQNTTRKIDHERGYPEAFVMRLTDSGWLAA